MQGVPRGFLFGFIDLNQPMNMYYFVLAVFVLGVFAIWRITNSPFGMILKSVRENENRAISLGFSVNHYKLAAFVMSAGLAGLAGGMKALVFQFATLTDVSWQMSGEVILMTLLGGIGTLIGPLSARPSSSHSRTGLQHPTSPSPSSRALSSWPVSCCSAKVSSGSSMHRELERNSSANQNFGSRTLVR